jgi:adenylate kinase
MMLALIVDEEELTKRLLLRGLDSGRADDTDENIIRNRINVYNEQTAVAAEYYANQNKYHGIDGVGSIDEIFNRLKSIIVEQSH